jgi:hypothetical protein
VTGHMSRYNLQANWIVTMLRNLTIEFLRGTLNSIRI